MENNSIRADIMEMVKAKFSGLSFWNRIESNIALMCAELTEPNDDAKEKEFVRQLKILKEYLHEQSVPEEDLKFIDEEINLHEQTKIVSLYEEKDDSLPPEVVASYSRLGKGSEGLVAIPQKYNYNQLSKLSNGVYDKTGLVKFYISNEQEIYGKIVAEIWEHTQEIPIATVVESKKKEQGTDEPMWKAIKLFGERYAKNEVKVIKEINLPFYVYRFITEKNNDLILITTSPYAIGDYVIHGVETKCSDFKALTDSAKLPTKLPFFFAQKVTNRILSFKNHNEFKERLDGLGITNEKFFNYPFTVTKGNKTWRLLQPKWYKWLIWSWLTHQGKGIFNNYPLHLLIIGPKMSGKSLLMNTLHARSKENRNIFSGASSTLKSLVPSFKYNPAKLGYLAESNRFSFCDEFFRCLTNSRTTKEGSDREESVAIMNDLLEHQKREAGSGVSRVNVNMTSRIIATTNPIKGIQSVSDLIKSYDGSFLSRWLVYHQTEEHVRMVRDSNDANLQLYDFKISNNNWVSILDYLQSFSADYDLKRVKEIHKEVPNILNETLNNHYDARHMHHIECLIDGIIKTRCMLDGDMSFKATEEDYLLLKEVWLNIIRSWMENMDVRNVPKKDRIFYLPENCQHLFWKINEKRKPVSREEVEEIALKAMTRGEYFETWSILIDMELIVESDGFAKPYYYDDVQDVNQTRLGDE